MSKYSKQNPSDYEPVGVIQKGKEKRRRVKIATMYPFGKILGWVQDPHIEGEFVVGTWVDVLGRIKIIENKGIWQSVGGFNQDNAKFKIPITHFANFEEIQNTPTKNLDEMIGIIAYDEWGRKQAPPSWLEGLKHAELIKDIGGLSYIVNKLAALNERRTYEIRNLINQLEGSNVQSRLAMADVAEMRKQQILYREAIDELEHTNKALIEKFSFIESTNLEDIAELRTALKKILKDVTRLIQAQSETIFNLRKAESKAFILPPSPQPMLTKANLIEIPPAPQQLTQKQEPSTEQKTQ